MTYTIGADPEMFVVGQDGTFINGHGLIGGTKEKPFRVRDGAVQVDGMALEFNIDPASSRTEFVRNVRSVKDQLNAMVKGGRVVAESVAHFDPDWFKRQPKASRILGCDPDFDAWTMSMNPAPQANRPMRTAAGHVHIGWTEGKDVLNDWDHFEDCAAMIRHLDTIVGPWTVIADPGSEERRSMYGKAGAFRAKPYGVEWRVPSNFWLNGYEGEMYDRVTAALERWDAGDIQSNPDVVNIINNSDYAAARELVA